MQTLPIEQPRPIRWTRDDYEQMTDTGLFADRRVELIDGEIIEMPAMKGPHAVALELVRDILLASVGPGYRVRQQVPLALGLHDLPEPDTAVVAGEARDFVADHPVTAVLVVEISDTTLALDQGRKRAMYAAAGIPDYWVLDLNARVLHRYRSIATAIDADGRAHAAYTWHEIARAGDTVTPLAFPGAPIAVAALLP